MKEGLFGFWLYVGLVWKDWDGKSCLRVGRRVKGEGWIGLR